MNDFLKNVGFFAICLLTVYIYKRISEYYYLKRLTFYEDDNVYKAAEEFVQGASANNVRAILTDSYSFDEKNAEDILSQALPHRNDNDGGYHAFIKSVNKLIGEDVYSELHRMKKDQ